MNNRFNFRIWDNKNKKYTDPFNYMSLDGGILIQATDEFINYVYDPSDVECSKDFDLTIEQCTGLKDRNGKFIYEGDYIRGNGLVSTYKVFWEDGSYCLKSGVCFSQHEADYYKIIGNIHENPELVSEVKNEQYS